MRRQRGNIMQQKKQQEPRDIVTEQHELSMLLMKLLLGIYLKIKLEIVDDTPTSVTAYTPDDVRLYDIFCETYEGTTKYWIRVQNGERRLIEFGRRENDGAFFSDEEFNYLGALYNLRQRYNLSQYPWGKDMPATLANLKSQKPKPDLERFDAWSKERIEVIKYLKDVLRNK